jgi:hypothetical protein
MAEPKPDTVNGRVLAFLRGCVEPVALPTIMEATGVPRHRAITACSELCLARLIDRTSNGTGTFFSALTEYPQMPAIGARRGVQLSPCIGVRKTA